MPPPKKNKPTLEPRGETGLYTKVLWTWGYPSGTPCPYHNCQQHPIFSCLFAIPAGLLGQPFAQRGREGSSHIASINPCSTAGGRSTASEKSSEAPGSTTEATCTPTLPRYLSQSFLFLNHFELSFYYLQLKESLNVRPFMYSAIHLIIRQVLETERSKKLRSKVDTHINHRSSVERAT